MIFLNKNIHQNIHPNFWLPWRHTWKVRSHSCKPVGGWMEVIRRLCCPCPLAALKSPNVVGVDGYGTKPVGLNDRETATMLTSKKDIDTVINNSRLQRQFLTNSEQNWYSSESVQGFVFGVVDFFPHSVLLSLLLSWFFSPVIFFLIYSWPTPTHHSGLPYQSRRVKTITCYLWDM